MAGDIGVVGLAVMGSNLALNLVSRGLSVVGFNRDPKVMARVAASEPRLQTAPDLAAFVQKLERPRRILVLVAAGAAVDAVIDGLEPHLDPGDVIVDAGNSHWTDTDRRAARAAASKGGWRFMGMGVSGGAEGARKGPSLMPGGDLEAYERLRPVLEKIAAVGVGGPCVTHCGKGSAGHFVKMVHNGIEYGDMQLLAEAASLLRDGLGLPAAQVADTFDAWGQAELESYLVKITAAIFRTEDPERPGALLLDAIEDRAGQKGTGAWTVGAAAELAVAIPTIASAVDARIVSAGKPLRIEAERAFAPVRPARVVGIGPDDVRAALWSAKVASYAQGFALLRTASEAKGYGTDLAEVARIWTAGCIIAARLLGDIRAAFQESPPPASLVLAPAFTRELKARLPALRSVVSAATRAGRAVPGMSASLAWLEGITTARGTASLIQAQRDYFGAHTFERVGRPGVAVHHEWS